MFKRNRSKEDTEKEGKAPQNPAQDVGLATEFEEWEKGSSDFDDEEYRGYERGEELLEDTDTLHAFRQLRNKLDEFERAREELRAHIESTAKLLPGLNEEKKHLGKSIHQKREKIVEITNLIPNLEKKKENMQKDIVRKQEKRDRLEKEIHEGQEKITEITNMIPNLERNRKNLQEYMERDQKEITRIDEEINLISFAQRYRRRLVKP